MVPHKDIHLLHTDFLPQSAVYTRSCVRLRQKFSTYFLNEFEQLLLHISCCDCSQNGNEQKNSRNMRTQTATFTHLAKNTNFKMHKMRNLRNFI